MIICYREFGKYRKEVGDDARATRPRLRGRRAALAPSGPSRPTSACVGSFHVVKPGPWFRSLLFHLPTQVRVPLLVKHSWQTRVQTFA